MNMLCLENYIIKLINNGYIPLDPVIKEKGVSSCPICDCKSFYNFHQHQGRDKFDDIFVCLKCGPYRKTADLGYFPMIKTSIPNYNLSSYLRHRFESNKISNINNITDLSSKDTLDLLVENANANIPEFSDRQYYLLKALESLQENLGEKICINKTDLECEKKAAVDSSRILNKLNNNMLAYYSIYLNLKLNRFQMLEDYLVSFSYNKKAIELEYCLKDLHSKKYISYDNRNGTIEILSNGHEYLENHKIKMLSISDKIIKSQELYNIDNKLIKENIEKCDKKIEEEDFTGAITNARSFLESLLLNIYHQIKGEDYNPTGNLPKLYKEVSKLIGLNIEKDMEDNKKQVLSGLISIISGISGISNGMSDRHGRLTEYDNRELKRISILAVNSVKTISLYLNNDIL